MDVMCQKRSQRGNILFLILLAVILFAALSYAVTSSMRGGGNNAAKESAQTEASHILNYFTQIDTAVQRMMMTGGSGIMNSIFITCTTTCMSPGTTTM